MKQFITILLMALGMCSINTMAQKRGKLYTEENGYQWRIVYSEDYSKKGVEGINGNILIPLSRGYDMVCFHPGHNIVGWFRVIRNGKHGVCDLSGDEIIAPTKYDDVYLRDHYSDKIIGYFDVSVNGAHGVCDITGREIIPCRYKDVSLYVERDGFTNYFYYHNSSGKRIQMDIRLDGQGKAIGSSIASSSSSSSSSNSSSSNNNSGNNTTTIIVEHHRDPIPVQEWQQCTSCWGSGNCRNCAGSGTNYIGSTLRRCSMCGGNGRCTTCSGKGGKNVTVYR